MPATKRSFRFGAVTSMTQSRTEYVELARKIEDLGYAVLAAPDHFGEQFTPFVQLMLAADVTQHLRLGTYVCSNDFRHPVVLAKDAATLDLLSEGRLELGLGAGYLSFDYAASGIPKDSPGVRVDRLTETVEVIKGLFSDGPVSVSGTYYTVTELDGQPKPHQKPYPPLLIGGSSKRMLSLAAREADIVSFVVPPGGEWADFMHASWTDAERRVEIVRQAAGDRFDALELNTLVFDVIVTDQREAVAEQRAPEWGTTPEQMVDGIHFLVGTVERMIEEIQGWRERLGISYVTVFPEAIEAFAPVVARLAGT